MYVTNLRQHEARSSDNHSLPVNTTENKNKPYDIVHDKIWRWSDNKAKASLTINSCL